MSNYYKTLLIFIGLLLVLVFMRNKYEYMDHIISFANGDFNVFYPIDHGSEHMYKIYNLAEQAYVDDMTSWGMPRKSLLGIDSKGNLGENVEKWLVVVEYAKRKNKGAKSAFKAFVSSESNGRWLGVSHDKVVTHANNKTLWTFTPIGEKNYVMSLEDGRFISEVNGELIVSNSGKKLVLILDLIN